ncbi:hypothetical protein VNO77_25320 [Canavalia gladiata]|uniref:Uncharacterized protein n=1 Tax=Canavalia gladiata TaxID=3824 RepID=A0AAN9L990_CANGL
MPSTVAATATCLLVLPFGRLWKFHPIGSVPSLARPHVIMQKDVNVMLPSTALANTLNTKHFAYNLLTPSFRLHLMLPSYPFVISVDKTGHEE